MELKNAFDLEDPTTYVSSLPVHQDGTCNGLQHYAALGGDAIGAQQVNLAAGDRPSDVYTHISLLVEKDIAIDAEAGDPVAQLLLGKVSRKVVKQTVPHFSISFPWIALLILPSFFFFVHPS